MRPVKKIFSLLGAAVFVFAFSAAAESQTLESQQPGNEAVRAELKKDVSTLNIGFEASSDELAAVLNQMIGNEIYKGSTKTKGLSADIIRKGPISVTASDNYVYLTVPVTIALQYGGFTTPAVYSKLKFKLWARITPDWMLHAEIYYLGLSDLFADELGVGPLSIRPRSIVDGITQPLQVVISDLISKKFNERYSLKAQVVKAWDAARKPVLLNKDYHAWLKMTPQEVILYPLSAANNRVKMSIGLKSFTEVVVGPEPAPAAPTPLPDLKLVNGGDKTFRIALNTDLFYADILQIAAPLLLNKDFGSDGKSIILKNLDIYGNGDRLIVKLETSGSLDGIVYLTCRPWFNTQTNVFSVEDVDFEMSTRNFLLKTAAWFLHSSIRDKIKEKINLNLTERLQQARDAARKAMDQVKLAEHVFLRGQLKDIRLHDVIVQKEKLSIRVYTEGETTVRFQ